MTAFHPLVSVLMASKDEPSYRFDMAMRELLSQSFSDFEIVLIDDGSTDARCRQNFRDWSDCDPRVRLFVEENRGLARSLNFGLGHCRAELVARHDSDDWSSQQRLELQVKRFLDQPDLVVLGSQAWICRADGMPLWATHLPQDDTSIRAFFKYANPFVHGSTMFRRDVARRVGGYRIELNGAEDYDFFWRLSEYGRLENLPEPLYWHRKTGASISAVHAQKQAVLVTLIQELGRARETMGEDHLEDSLQKVISTRPTSEWRGIGMCRRADQCLLAGSTRLAIFHYLKALREPGMRIKAMAGLIRALLFVVLPFLAWKRWLFRA